MTQLTAIETRAKLYAEAREKLAAIVSDLNAGIEALKRNAMPEIKRAVARAGAGAAGCYSGARPDRGGGRRPVASGHHRSVAGLPQEQRLLPGQSAQPPGCRSRPAQA